MFIFIKILKSVQTTYLSIYIIVSKTNSTSNTWGLMIKHLLALQMRLKGRPTVGPIQHIRGK